MGGVDVDVRVVALERVAVSDCEVAVVFAHAETDEVILIEFQFWIGAEWLYVVDMEGFLAAASRACRVFFDERVPDFVPLWGPEV